MSVPGLWLRHKKLTCITRHNTDVLYRNKKPVSILIFAYFIKNIFKISSTQLPLKLYALPSTKIKYDD